MTMYCARCDAPEARIDGYCSGYCRDMAEVEAERDALIEALERIGTMSPDGTGTLRPIWSKLEMVKIARQALSQTKGKG